MFRTTFFHFRISACWPLFLLALICLSGCGSGETTSIGQAVAMTKAIQEVQKALSTTVTQVDAAAKNKIVQMQGTANDVQDRLNKSIKDTSNQADDLRASAVRDAFNLLAAVNREVEEKSLSGFDSLNEAMAGAAAIVDGLPLSHVKDTVFAIKPYRIRLGSSTSEVSIFGYFPSAGGQADSMEVTINKKRIPSKFGPGRLFVDIPKELLVDNASHRLEIRVTYPKKHFWSKATSIEARIALLKEFPFRFNIEALRTIPHETIVGNAHAETLSSSQGPDSFPSHTAEGLFNITVTNREAFDATTARFQAVRIVGVGGGKPNPSCPDYGAEITGWTGNQLNLHLWAPNCPQHWEGPTFGGYLANGGGSNVTVQIIPTFTAKRKGAKDSEPMNSSTIELRPDAIGKVDLPSGWSSATVNLSYSDNFDKREDFGVVKAGVGKAGTSMWEAESQGDKLLIHTRSN